MWYIHTYFLLIFTIIVSADEEDVDQKNCTDNNEVGKMTFQHIKKAPGLNDVKWSKGIVPYYLDIQTYDSIVHDRLRVAMSSIEEASCVRFLSIPEPHHDKRWIHVTNPDQIRECVHGDIFDAYEVKMILGLDCFQNRDILHSLMHALGFNDEVTHPQRNEYVRVLWENINPKYQKLFRIKTEDFSPINTEYDTMSIMHFHDRAFSRNGQATIATLIPGLVINPTNELSPLDKMRLRLMFGQQCNQRKIGDLLDTCKMAFSSKKMNGESDVNTKRNCTLIKPLMSKTNGSFEVEDDKVVGGDSISANQEDDSPNDADSTNDANENDASQENNAEVSVEDKLSGESSK